MTPLYISRCKYVKKCSASLKIFCRVPHSYNKTGFGAVRITILLRECKWENSELWRGILKRFGESKNAWASSWRMGKRFHAIKLMQGSAGYSWGTAYSLWPKWKEENWYLIETFSWLSLSVLLKNGHNFEYCGRKKHLNFLVFVASDLYL